MEIDTEQKFASITTEVLPPEILNFLHAKCLIFGPFGMQISPRSFSSPSYRYGFNGMEKDDELKGEGNSYDFGARLYDSRLGRWLAVDPVSAKYPELSTFTYAVNNPIIFIDPEGKEVIWHSSLRNNTDFKSIIEHIEKTDVFKTIHKRFIMNQDNIIYTKMWQGNNAWAWAKRRTAAGYPVEFASELFVNDKLIMDPTLAVKVILHEGLHQKNKLARANEGITPATYPNLHKNENDPNVAEAEHEAMAEGNINLLIDGMKQFDQEIGTTHSDEWYNAMAWWGSLSRATKAWSNIAAADRALYEKIQTNEKSYMDYKAAKARYDSDKSAKNKADMDAALLKIDKALFNKTRNRATNDPIK